MYWISPAHAVTETSAKIGSQNAALVVTCSMSGALMRSLRVTKSAVIVAMTSRRGNIGRTNVVQCIQLCVPGLKRMRR